MSKSTKEPVIAVVGSLQPKSVFNYGGIDWLVLDKLGDGVICLASKILFERPFDTDNYNDWADSSLRYELNYEFLEAMEREGAEFNRFLPMVKDLTADDGLKDYGSCDDTISLISCDQYRKYRAIIPNADDLWWTCTAYSTKSNGYSYNARVVLSDGTLGYYSVCRGLRGVRPLCTLKASVLVSVINEEQG